MYFIFETVEISVSRNSGVRTGFWLEAENMIDEILIQVYVTDCRCGYTLVAASCYICLACSCSFVSL
jgi:hypothetical protein